MTGVFYMGLRMKQAKLLAAQTKCVRRGVGAVIVSSAGDLLSEGYNGMFKGGSNLCGDGKCDREGLCSGREMDIGCIHAEMNAILHCARLGRSTVGATLVVTTLPCHNCAKMIVQAGIVEVVVQKGSYPDYRGVELLRGQGVLVTEVEECTETPVVEQRGIQAPQARDMRGSRERSAFGVAMPDVVPRMPR